MIALYSIAIEIAVWLVLVPLQVIRGRHALAERLGRVPRSPSVPRDDAEEPRNPEEPEERLERLLLVHAVSAGEMNAASAIVHELAERGWTFVLSAGNEDARRTAERIARHHPEVLRVVAWPWDRRAVRRWLASMRCDGVVVIETEIWPNLFLACRDLGVPLIVAGARIDPSAARWYRRFRLFFRRVLSAASAILTVDEGERATYLAIGASPETVSVAGSVKADACLIRHEATQPRNRTTVVAASTHDGEERILLDAVPAGVDLVIVPRHVKRAASIRRIAGNRATVIDRMGALSQLYTTAAIAIIGGTFVDLGGHDVFEPARAGCAIVTGPHVDRIHHTVAAMLDADAIRVTTAERLRETLTALLASDAERDWLATNARAFAAAQGGAAKRCADVIEQLSLRA